VRRQGSPARLSARQKLPKSDTKMLKKAGKKALKKANKASKGQKIDRSLSRQFEIADDETR
jgi:hypothetical protein